MLIKLDKKTCDFEWSFRLSNYINLDLDYNPPARTFERTAPGNQYRDLFIKNCKEVCKDTKTKGWVTEGDITGAMPNVLTTIPAMTILNILLPSINKDETNDSFDTFKTTKYFLTVYCWILINNNVNE